MNYEQKYKEALERAKTKLTNEVAADIFPELKESEDERIRKALMQNLKERFGTKGNMGEGLNMPDVLAWLEKQGEQKAAWSKEMGGLCLDAVELLKNYGEGVNPKSQLGIKIERAAAFLTDLYHESFYPNTYNPRPDLKLAAWSEEDETTKNNISHIIRQYDKISKRENQPCYYVGDCLLWMQNIKDRVQPQPKQEWSKEDFNNLKDAISLLAHPAAVCTESNDELRFKIIDWLKSLRPQKAWKPSKEQMEALHEYIWATEPDKSKAETVISLYYDLKKLKD